MKRRLPKLQTLERRTLLAADAGVIASPAIVSDTIDVDMPSSSLIVERNMAEGEDSVTLAPDLVRFARELDESGTVFYGAHWCPACTQQKQLFQDGGDELPFVDVTNPDRTASQFAIDNDITVYPTWQFPDGSRVESALSLEQLSERSGVPIRLEHAPSFKPISDQTVLIGSPLHLPIDAYDPNHSSLSFEVTVQNPELLEAVILSGNRSVRVDMEHYGDMVFQLFEQRAPTATQRFIELAESDFYDDIIFHRVIDNFVIQGGDPTGTGRGASTLPDFDDDFHPDLQHNRSGVLSYVKSSDDTNNSQFFVTETPTRHLDFNHSVFGLLVEGDDVREAISEHAVDNASKPTTDITINTIDVFQDLENAVLMLRGKDGQTGTTEVTVTVSDRAGSVFVQSFRVDVEQDTVNGQPFLNPIDLPLFPPGSPATVQLTSTDVEGDAVAYEAEVLWNGGARLNAQASIDQNGELTVVPNDATVREVRVSVSVSPGPGVTGNSSSDRDTQTLTFQFGDPVITPGIDLLSLFDSGRSSTDNVTREVTSTFLVQGATIGETVELVVEGQVVGSAVALDSNVAVTATLPTNDSPLGRRLTVIARQQLGTEVTSFGSIAVTLDTVPPTLQKDSFGRINPGVRNTIDLRSNDDVLSGVTYQLVSGPAGSNIDSFTGQITWNAPATIETDPVFIVSLTDRAGNTSVETFSVPVSPQSFDDIVEIRLNVVDLEGQPIDSVQVGQSFRLQLIGVDNRSGLDRSGVFSIFADVSFDDSLVTPQGLPSQEFELTPSGVFADGLIDEWGAASDATTASYDATSLISEATFVAAAAGTLTFRSDPVEGLGREILLYGINDLIPLNHVTYGETTLQILPLSETAIEDVDRNGEVTPRDALMVINQLSSLQDGSVRTGELPVPLAQRFDTTKDGWVTPQDALMIINKLHQNAQAFSAANHSRAEPLSDTLSTLISSDREDAVDQLLKTEDPALF